MPIVEMTRITPEFVQGANIYRITQGLYVNELAERARVDRKTIGGVLTGKIRRVRSEIVGRLVGAMDISRRDAVYLFGLVGIQLPLFSEIAPSWDERTGSIGSVVDKIVYDERLDGSQMRRFARIIIPYSLALARRIREFQPFSVPAAST